MQPIQPYQLYQPYQAIPIQNQIPQKRNASVAVMPNNYPPPLSGLINTPNPPQTTPKQTIKTPPLSGLVATPVNYPTPTMPPAVTAGIVMGPSVDDMFSTPSNITLTDAELNPIQQDLYNKKQYMTLSKMNKNWDYSYLYSKVQDNKDFNELLNSKIYQGKDGFYNLLETVRTLTAQRKEAIKNMPSDNPPIVPCPIDYKKYYINDYLRIINNFVKSSNYSDDLKIYYLNTEGKKLDSYYGNLDSISKVINPLDALTNKQY